MVWHVFGGIEQGARVSSLTCTFVGLANGVAVVRPIFAAMNLVRSVFCFRLEHAQNNHT